MKKNGNFIEIYNYYDLINVLYNYKLTLGLLKVSY